MAARGDVEATSRRHRERAGEKKSSSMSPPGGQHIILTALRGRRRLAARHAAITCAHSERDEWTAAHTRAQSWESLKQMWAERNDSSWGQQHEGTTQHGRNTTIQRWEVRFFFFWKTHNYGSVQKLIRRITPHYMMTVEYSSLKRCNNSNNRLQLLPFNCISFHHLTLPCSFFPII